MSQAVILPHLKGMRLSGLVCLWETSKGNLSAKTSDFGDLRGGTSISVLISSQCLRMVLKRIMLYRCHVSEERQNADLLACVFIFCHSRIPYVEVLSLKRRGEQLYWGQLNFCNNLL